MSYAHSCTTWASPGSTISPPLKRTPAISAAVGMACRRGTSSTCCPRRADAPPHRLLKRGARMTTTATTSGLLRGTPDDGVLVFRGIPYARPPVGALRFAPPQPPAPWNGVRDATTFGPPAMQGASPASPGQSVAAACDEDCLTLNVWTPAADAGRRPVLVWLHGGAFIIGAGSMPMYRGAALAARGDVVVVTVNYRLGLFGYLRGIDVCGATLPSTGNAGLLDQLAALAWVQDEIAAFGGDPENVTVIGQSAGAASISAMLV